MKKFFTENDIELKKRHRIKGFTIHESTLPSYEQLSDLLRISDLRARTAILMLLSSGLRIGELSRLRLGNIELDVTPAGIYLSSKFTKSRRKRVTFISTEAQASLKAYLEKRKSRGHSINDDSPVIATRKGDPVTVWGLYEIVHRPMAQLSKKDPDGWYTLRPHILRKFFITQMLLAGVPDAIVDAMVGHQRYLAKEYELFEVPHFRQWYEKAMPRLLILEQPKLSKESVVLELSTKLAEALGVPYEELSQSLKQATTPAIQERMIGKVWDLIENRFKPITELSYVENRSGKPTRVKEICVKPEHFIEK
ncbi:MAG: site-specific integrase [Candidatus Methanomethylicaceae archaeon]